MTSPRRTSGKFWKDLFDWASRHRRRRSRRRKKKSLSSSNNSQAAPIEDTILADNTLLEGELLRLHDPNTQLKDEPMAFRRPSPSRKAKRAFTVDTPAHMDLPRVRRIYTKDAPMPLPPHIALSRPKEMAIAPVQPSRKSPLGLVQKKQQDRAEEINNRHMHAEADQAGLERDVHKFMKKNPFRTGATQEALIRQMNARNSAFWNKP